jgi:hypothetical protein
MHALLLLLALALPQGSPEPAPSQEPPIPTDHDAIHREMEEMFKQVELRQREIDRMLYDASAGKKALQPITESGIGGLVPQARDRSAAAESGMRRILKLAKSHTHQGGGT